MDDPKKIRPQTDMPTQIGGTAAVSSSSGDNRPPAGGAAYHDMPTSAGIGPTTFSSPKPIPKATYETSYGTGSGDGTLLELGTVLASRYEILALLGEGGMGAVYKARDLALDRLVALKVIRPALAQNSAIVERFKQELRLSHTVTHKNVVRMYDLGEDAGIKFITMEFIEGRDLRSLIEEKGKLAPEEAVAILQQVCKALEAAHTVGVIHRDLKPQNIMQDASGRIVVMDFGLARTLAGDGMTQSGALVGTMEYMSPEQALGRELDQRSDIFALGLICYEMLTGKMPFRAESVLASLIKRTQERAEPISSLDPAIPATLSGIVSKCLEREASQRYKDTGEILVDLEVWQGKRAAASLGFNPNVETTGLSGRWILIPAVIAVILLLVGGIFLVRHFMRPHTEQAAVGPPISLAIMPFYNASPDPSLDWMGSSVSEMLTTSIGQSAHVRMVSPDRLHQVLRDLHITGRSQMDTATLRRLAEFTNADTVVYGQFDKVGEEIRIETRILDLAHDSGFILKTDVPQERDLVSSVDRLADDLRQRLASNPEILKELEAHAQHSLTNSVEALHAYNDGLQLALQGNNLDAVTRFEAATVADPNFALAFSKLGEIYSNLGHDDLAEKASRRAVELSDSLPAREKNLIEANHARITNDSGKAIQAYEKLEKENPEDTDVQFALAGLYEQTSNFPAAKQRLANVLARDPKNVDVLLASGRVEIKASNPQGGLDYLNRALTLAIQLGNQEQKAAILQATGIAYGMLSKPDQALSNYQESLAIKKQIGDKRGLAASLEQIASIQDEMGHPDQALASYKDALATRREIGDKAGIGNTLIDLGSFYHGQGKQDEALKYIQDALQIERDLGDEASQANCLGAIGSIHLDRGEFQDALTYLQQGYELHQKLKIPGDLAEPLHNLAEANAKIGQYDTALALYLKAIEDRRTVNDQRGIALESESMAKIFAAQGRYGAALSAMQDALKIFQASKEASAFTVEITGGWGDLLGQVGRVDEGNRSLQDALNIAHQIKNDAAVSVATNMLGDAFFYKGDYSNAQQQYDRALQIATKISDKEQVLLARVDKARTDINQGHAQAAIASLKKLTQDADAMGLKSVAVESSVYLGAAMLAINDTKGARQQLDLSLARAEKLGLRIVEAKAHYQLALLLTKTGSGKEATPHYREVVRILEAISKEDGSARVLERADLQDIYRSSIKGFQGAS